jgi:hypothetical protein
MSTPKITGIKNGIKVGTEIPKSRMKTDNGVGKWAEDMLEQNGHVIDKHGRVDMPNIGAEMKTKRTKTNAAWTQGSIKISDIENTPLLVDTPVWEKMKNQNHVIWDPVSQTVIGNEMVNMDNQDCRDLLQQKWTEVRNQIISGHRSKNISSKDGSLILDGYNSNTSYNIRISNTGMKKIKNISRTKNSMDKLFDF